MTGDYRLMEMMRQKYDAGLSQVSACFCMGPQNGQPLCPCAMKNVFIRDGRYIRREVDLGPAPPEAIASLEP